MKNLSLLTFTLLLFFVSCDSKSKANERKKLHEDEPAVVVVEPNVEVVEPIQKECENSDDPFFCVRQACSYAKAQYKEELKVCECPEGSVFYAKDGGSCESGKPSGTGRIFPNGKYTYFIPNATDNLSFDQLSPILKQRSVPLFPGNQQLRIYNSSKKVLDFMADLSDTNSFFGFMAPVTELDGVDINSAVSAPLSRNTFQFFFYPTENKFNFSLLGLTQEALPTKIEAAIEKRKDPTLTSEVMSYSLQGCAEICVEKTFLSEDNEFIFDRIRTFSGGNPIQDSVRVFNKELNRYELSVVFLNDFISHVFVAREFGTYELFSNDGDSIKVQESNVNDKSEAKGISSSKAPVILFEGSYSNYTDAAALIGPYRDQSYYGWFKKNDNRPFYYGKTPSLVNEEEIGSIDHSDIVSNLASADSKSPIIPLAPNSLINGDVELVIKRLETKAVASLSAAYTFTNEICKKTNLSKSINATKEKVLWIVAAGNDGKEIDPKNFPFCPQSLDAENIMIVSSISGAPDKLSKTTSFGQNYADIAVNGCLPGKDKCDVAGTSFAAPRLARFIADMISLYPDMDINTIKNITLITARVPLVVRLEIEQYFLPIKSGGVLDEAAAKSMLEKTAKEIKFDLSKCKENHSCFNNLVDAKKDQYPNVSRRKIKTFLSNQITRIITGVL